MASKKKTTATLAELQGFFGKSKPTSKPKPKRKPLLLAGRVGKRRAIQSSVRGKKGKEVKPLSATPLKRTKAGQVTTKKHVVKKPRQNRFLDKKGFKKQTRVDK